MRHKGAEVVNAL